MRRPGPPGQLLEQAGGAPGSMPREGVSPRVSAVLELRPWLEAIARISAAVNNMQPLSNVLNAIAATLCRLLGYDFGAVLLVDESGQRLLMRGTYGLSSAYVEVINSEKPIRLGHGQFGEGPSSRAFRSRQPVVIRDYEDDETVGPWAGVAVEQGYRSMVAVPLVVSGRAIGTFNCYTRAVHQFSKDEVLLLTTIANQAAIAIEAARLREQERATISRLEVARRSLEMQAAILERSEAIHTELTRTALEGAGLRGIAQTLTRILQGSVVIDDPAGLALAEAVRGDVPATIPAGLLDEEGRRLVARVLDGREPALLGPEEHPGLARAVFLAPVVISSELAGRLWVIDPEVPLDALGRRALEHGATVVALELLKQRVANEVETRLRGELLDDVLAGRPLAEQALRVRASSLGHDLRARHAAVVLALDAPHGDERRTNDRDAGRVRQLHTLVAAAVRRMHADALVGERDDRIVVLVPEHPRRGTGIAVELGEAVRRDVKRFITDGTASVAVGSWADEVSGFVRSYRVAKGALELAQRFGGDRTVTLDDLGVHGLLLAVGQPDELVRFADQTLGPLRTYDQRRGSDLVVTLRTYLASSCRSVETATALVVHPNTVSYRLRRIESILGFDLTRPETQLKLQLALMVDDVAGTGGTAREVKAMALGVSARRPPLS